MCVCMSVASVVDVAGEKERKEEGSGGGGK